MSILIIANVVNVHVNRVVALNFMQALMQISIENSSSVCNE